MELIKIQAENIDGEHICCAIGNDKQNSSRAQTKKAWLKERFDEGLVFRRFDGRGKFFIEYMPIETAWKPLVGQGYLVIHCLWVSGQFKGQGLSKILLQACIADAEAQGMRGIAVVTSSRVKPFLTDKQFFLKHGFVSVDLAPPYFELLALKLQPHAEDPKFSAHAKAGTTAEKDGFAFVYSDQCPFMQDFVGSYASLAQKHGFVAKVIKLQNHEQAQQWGSPFGTLGIYFNGKFLLHELLTETKFENLLINLKNGQ